VLRLTLVPSCRCIRLRMTFSSVNPLILRLHYAKVELSPRSETQTHLVPGVPALRVRMFQQSKYCIS
jgi:hypothetical protein